MRIIDCPKEGASIGYKFLEDDSPWIGWRIYNKTVELSDGEDVRLIALRIEYTPSDAITKNH